MVKLGRIFHQTCYTGVVFFIAGLPRTGKVTTVAELEAKMTAVDINKGGGGPPRIMGAGPGIRPPPPPQPACNDMSAFNKLLGMMQETGALQHTPQMPVSAGMGGGKWSRARYSRGNPIVETRWSQDHIIFTMGNLILVRRYLYIKSGPRVSKCVCAYTGHF